MYCKIVWAHASLDRVRVGVYAYNYGHVSTCVTNFANMHMYSDIV